jgi:hypothetical protein
MYLHGLIHSLPAYIRTFIGAFIIVMSIGYFTGLLFVRQADSMSPDGIEENYLGNEDEEAATVMKFQKGEREMLTILHTHILSISFIFFFMGALISITSISNKLKAFLMTEPFISIVLTFGGIYLMWKGVLWMKYIVMISGILMTVVFVMQAGIVFIQLFKKR